MKLRAIFDQLSAGELSQISLGGDMLGEIAESNYPKITSHVNLALTELHKRFMIKEGTVLLALQTGLTTYVLDRKYAVSNTASTEPVKYISDASSPYLDDVFKIERVYDEDDLELALNVFEDTLSVLTPGYRVVVVPTSEEFVSTTLRVVYRANHRVLDVADWADPDVSEIDLPYTYLEALLLYVASRVMNPIGFAGGNGFHEGNNYMAKFEKACALLEFQNYRVDQQGQNTRLEKNGWV